MKERIEELAKIGREAYNADMRRFCDKELAERVAQNKIWAAVKKIQEDLAPDFMTPEWYNWIHSGQYSQQMEMKKCKGAVLYRLACKAAGIGLVERYPREAYRNRSFRKHASAI